MGSCCKISLPDTTRAFLCLYSPIGAACFPDKMFLDGVFRPNLGILTGLCLLICAANVRRFRCREPSAGASLTRKHALFGSLNLLCSLVCMSCALFPAWNGGGGWSSAFIGFLWVGCIGTRLPWFLVSLTKCIIGHGFSSSAVLLRGFCEPVVVLCKLQLPWACTVPYDELARSVSIDMDPNTGKCQSFCARHHPASDCLCKCDLYSLIDPWTCKSLR